MKEFVTSLRAICLYTLITGLLYPAAVSLVARTFFLNEANGSLIEKNGKVIGSELIAQSFSQPKYFWPRPSAVAYDASSSGATHFGLTSKELLAAVKDREEKGFKYEMRYASASGLDPHISPQAANAQVERISVARKITPERLLALITRYTESRQLGFLGQPRVNVLKLNLALDRGVAR